MRTPLLGTLFGIYIAVNIGFKVIAYTGSVVSLAHGVAVAAKFVLVPARLW